MLQFNLAFIRLICEFRQCFACIIKPLFRETSRGLITKLLLSRETEVIGRLRRISHSNTLLREYRFWILSRYSDTRYSTRAIKFPPVSLGRRHFPFPHPYLCISDFSLMRALFYFPRLCTGVTAEERSVTFASRIFQFTRVIKWESRLLSKSCIISCIPPFASTCARDR